MGTMMTCTGTEGSCKEELWEHSMPDNVGLEGLVLASDLMKSNVD
jgi:hypothetical protein